MTPASITIEAPHFALRCHNYNIDTNMPLIRFATAQDLFEALACVEDRIAVDQHLVRGDIACRMPNLKTELSYRGLRAPRQEGVFSWRQVPVGCGKCCCSLRRGRIILIALELGSWTGL